MPYRKSKKISKRRNKARTKRFRKSKRKTKYHKKKYVGGMFEFITAPVARTFGLDAESQQRKRDVAECKKNQDKIIEAAQQAKKNCGKTPSGPENDSVNLQPKPLNQNQPEMTDGLPSPDLPPVPQQGPLPPNGGKKKKTRRKNKKNTNKKYK